MDAVQQAKSGHPGAPMGMADIATVLFRDFMQFDAADPHWFDRDRFVLSNGHASMLLYSLLYLTGYQDMTLDQLKRFRQIDSKTAGHPEYKHADGIETTTGPLGQGVANAVGFALAERIMNAKFGDDLCKHWTYVFMGDGCLMEGISEEAISMAGHYKLGHLIAFWDNNSITIDGPTRLAVSDIEVERFRASGWHVQEIDGHDTDAIRDAITAARAVTDKPSMIACKTIIGFGFPTKAGTQKAHSDAPGEEEIAGARKILGWDSPPFVIPEPLLREWREIGAKGRQARMAWADRVKKAPAELRSEFERRNDGKLPADWKKAIAAARAEFIASGKEMATRSASGAVLDHLAAAIPELLGGSADLTPSNNTKAKGMIEIKPGEYDGTYMHYGVREHAHGRRHERHRAARRLDPLRRHLPVLLGLLPPVHPPRVPHADPDDLRHDPRLDRPRRGRPDPSAGRAARGAAGHPAPRGLSPGRSGRDRRMLGVDPGHAEPDSPPRPLPPADAAAPSRPRQREQVGQGRLYPVGGGGRRAQAHHLEHRLGTASRGRSA